MAGEWVNKTLGEVLTLQRGFDLPETKREAGVFPVIASTGRVGTHSVSMVKGPSVVIGRSGSLGGGQFIQSDFWPLNTTLWVKDFKGNDVRFCYYLLKSLDLATFNAGSGVPTLNRNHIHPLPVHVPSDVAEQRAIAHILGSLDDKIELNRRMNRTLEDMAGAIFKSWFVDFDPVRAKAAVRREHPNWTNAQVSCVACPNLKPEIAELFPDRLVNSELGEIPEGWEVRKLGDLVETVKGRSYKSEELVESDIALVTLKSFNRGGGYRPGGLKPFIGAYKPEQVLEPGEVVIACTDVTQAAEVIGRPAMVRRSPRYKRLVASLDTLIVRPQSGSVTTAFLYLLCITDAFKDHTYAHTTGTTVLHLAKEAVPSFQFSLAPAQLIQTFNLLVASMLSRIEESEIENESLAALRDTLLPKLISGELRVKDAERIVGRAL